ncbi:MAG: helix-turn-helix domain-containing protein [Phycisphaerales bacterium]
MAVDTLVEDKRSQAMPDAEIHLHVRTHAHWQVLRSPYRLRIFEAIRSSGGCSIKELADVLGSSTTALYYHLDLLARAGLIRATASEPEPAAISRGGRRPALFVALSSRIVVTFDPSDGRDRRRVAALWRAWLEESQQELLPTATASDEHDPESPASRVETGHLPSASTISTAAWEILTQAEAAEIRRHLQAVQQVLERARARRSESSNPVGAANYHVATTLVEARAPVLPSPTLVTRPVHAGVPALA